MIRNKRVVVTGGLGFIGSHLAGTLLEENDVIIVDDASTGRFDNIKTLPRSRLTVVEANIVNVNLEEVFAGCDFVFHQAALPSVPRSIADPVNSNEANVSGTVRVLTAAKNVGIERVVFASSSSVYGESPVLPKREDMPTKPLSPYAVTKLAAEWYCRVFEELYGLSTVSLRYFNVFGPRQDPSSQYAAVIPKFIASILNDSPPTVFGDGHQSRDFTFVKHVVNANILACESSQTGAFNIACGRSVSLNELIALINEILGKNIEPIYTAPRAGDVKYSRADVSKARSFGYQPNSNFRDELEETIRWLENGLKTKN
jgi:UDP-glucose 4-epimerase